MYSCSVYGGRGPLSGPPGSGGLPILILSVKRGCGLGRGV